MKINDIDGVWYVYVTGVMFQGERTKPCDTMLVFDNTEVEVYHEDSSQINDQAFHRTVIDKMEEESGGRTVLRIGYHVVGDLSQYLSYDVETQTASISNPIR